MYSKPFPFNRTVLALLTFHGFWKTSLPFLSPCRREALISPPSLLGKGAGGLGLALSFLHNVKSQIGIGGMREMREWGTGSGRVSKGSLMEFKGSLMEFKGSLMEFKYSLMEFKYSLMEFKGSLMECKGSLMEFKGSLMECKGSLMECKGSLMEFKYSLMEFKYSFPILNAQFSKKFFSVWNVCGFYQWLLPK
ncbi:hypothetical protein [Nostoc sp. DedQUE02]|uniref:hypothetical protein n=1 Tax=Nostoc sp. DedQUE02 TaxID=3075388 RepID=UPI00391B3CE8